MTWAMVGAKDGALVGEQEINTTLAFYCNGR